MENLKAKLKRQGGFTLVEMLIVVAIIAILIAVSIPLVSSSLEKAREATDDANRRSAIGLGNIYYLTEAGTTDFSTEVVKYYDIDSQSEGTLVDTAPTKGYGKGTTAGEDTVAKTGKVLQVTIKDPGNTTDSAVKVEWVDAGTP